jgi:MoaA/NifB/PqqE/SkfB family radical SAM enzyme
MSQASPPDAVLRARTRVVVVGVTGKCNLRCCYCHKADEVFEAAPSANADLSNDIIENAYRYCKDNGVRQVGLSLGGETTMLPDWPRRVGQFLEDAEIEAHIVSNFARLFNDDDLTALAKFRAIQISFDSADLQMVRKLRSKADLRTITLNIVRLRQRVTELGRPQTLIVNCVLWRDNIGGIAKLAGFCRELGIEQLLLTEGFISTQNNHTVPDTLDTLNDADVLTLIQQIVAAEEILANSATALRIQDHLRLRLDNLLDAMRNGTRPQNPAGEFHRRLSLSACKQPWQSPVITQTGKVLPCCIAPESAAVGDLSVTPDLAAILDSDPARAVRASILDGKSVLPCDNCSLASELPLADFVQEIKEWQGVAAAPPREIARHLAVWPDLFGAAEWPVTLEDAALAASQGVAVLNENEAYGLHRVLFDCKNTAGIDFRMRPKGRRRLRVDFASEGGRTMIGRVHIAATRSPTGDIEIGKLDCRVAGGADGLLQVSVRSAVPFSHVNITLMNEQHAVVYRGDGRSAVEISDVCVS